MQKAHAVSPPARVSSPTFVALIAALVWALVVVFLASALYDGDIRGLLCIGEKTKLPPAFASIPIAGPTGYDAPMYAALATDPFLRHRETSGYLDAPSYRATRMLVPLLAWLIAFGHAPAVIVSYQLICWGLTIGAVYILACWLRAENRSAWWALGAAATGGVAATVIRCTPDGAALFFILTALFLHARGRSRLALGLAVAAVLTRETSILAALALAADEFRRRQFRSAAGFAFIPATAAAAWQFYLRFVLGSAFNTAGGAFSLTLSWLPDKFATLFHGVPPLWIEAFGTLALMTGAVACVAVALKPAEWRAADLTLLAFGTMSIFLGEPVYHEIWAYGRTLIAIPVLAVVIAGRQGTRSGRRWLLILVTGLYAMAGLTVVGSEIRSANWRHRRAESAVGRTLAVRPTGVRIGPRPMTVSHEELAPQPPLWILPAASIVGRANASWQTQLVIDNPHAEATRMTLQLFGASGNQSQPVRVALTLGPHDRVQWLDAIAEVFGQSGAGAIRIVAERQQVAARALTAVTAVPTAWDSLLPALTEDQAVSFSRRAVLGGLVHDPRYDSGTRTSIGFFNLGGASITVRVEVFDGSSRRLGEVEERLAPHGFAQIYDVFARFRAPRLEDGHAEVYTVTPGGSFLAYASVARGESSTVVYVFPVPAIF